MEPSFEFFDHTADMGIRIRAATLADLLLPAGEGLYAVIGNLACRDSVRSVRLDLSANDSSLLLRDYLNELLILFDRDALLAKAVKVVEFTEHRLAVEVEVALVDQDNSEFDREVKAITYHELAISPIPGGFEATVIVDI